jgi:hypothetical protein
MCHQNRRPLAIFALSILSAVAGAGAARAQGTALGFEEEFALATDRAQALSKLIPGTEDHFYYHCLHAQNERRFGDVAPLLAAWIERFGRTDRVVEIENRQALLSFASDEAATYDFLRERLGLTFDRQRQVPGAAPDVPTMLDPALLASAALARRAFDLHPGTLDGFRPSALPGLASTTLPPDLLTKLLDRLSEPDVPNLPALVVRQLEGPRAGGFGALVVHHQLLLDQLEECARLRPALLDEPKFVQRYLELLRPGADVDAERDAAAREAWLDRLQAFADRLSAVNNSLKAHVLFHRLAHDLAAGKPDADRLLAYLRLPRNLGYVNPELVRGVRRSDELVDVNRDCRTGLRAIGDDEALVRAYLEHFLVSAGSVDAYAPYLRPDWLRRVFAETKILAGVGDMQRWYALLDDPGYYERLRDRVELLFPPTAKAEYAVGEPVSLAVDVKNVETLLIKVFEIDTFNYLRAEGREVDASIDLDGLVASEERTVRYAESPLRRVRRTLEFPSVDHAGVFVVELIGNGLSSRAMIRKGRLQLREHPGAAGHVCRVLDDRGQHLRDAALWLAGREYAADDAGEIVVPYSTDPGAKDAILRHGEFASLARLEHLGERYDLSAAVHVEREELLAGRRARIVVRPALRLEGRALPLGLLEEPALTVTAVDRDGVVSTQDVREPALANGLAADRDLVHEIQVPPGLASLSVALRGRVRSLSRGEPVALKSHPATFTLNGIDATDRTDCPLLGRTQGGYVLDVLGKDGEPRPDRAVHLRLTLRDYADALDVTLKTEARGRVALGALEGVESVRADGFPGGSATWPLRAAARTMPYELHGAAGATLRAPYLGGARTLDRSVASLFELRGDVRARDAFDRLALADGFLELRGLAPGDYELLLKETATRIAVRVTAGASRDGWAIGGARMLEGAGGAVLQIRGVSAANGELEIALANAGSTARVHVVATRYLPPFDPFEDLRGPFPPGPQRATFARADSTYHPGRAIGDEYRYILERRFAQKFPGNMLARPSLLLNPWALAESESAIGGGGGAGGRFGGRRGQAPGGGGAYRGPSDNPFLAAPGRFANVDFLPEPSRVLANLRPVLYGAAGSDGVVRVPLAQLGDGQLVHVVAVDAESTVYTTLALPEKPLEPASRRLARGLDPARHFAQKRDVEFLPAGGSAVLDDARTAKIETYDSLGAVFQMFRAAGDEELAEFAFVTRWPAFAPDEKRALYSKFACHELHFFLYQKDRAFFDAVVKPYLANKLDRTFLDRFLLEDDLRGYLEPWAFARLNVVERILLARRIAAQAASVARQVEEQVDLAPPDPERDLRRFRQALGGDALSAADGADKELGAHGRTYRGPGDAVPPADSPAAAAGPAEKAKDAQDAEPDRKLANKQAAAEEEEEPVLEERELLRRDQSKALYRAPDPTRAFVEQNYRNRRIDEQGADLVTANAFWRDFARADPRAPFVSTNVFAAANGTFAERMLALAVLDLPFEASEPETTSDGPRLTLRAASPLLLVRQEIAETPAVTEGAAPVLVSQNVFRLDEPYRFDGNQRRDAYLADELQVGVAYGCRVVVTNPTSSPRDVELLLQIPEGALPVSNGFETRGVPTHLEPYATASIQYAFYLPRPGAVNHYPVHVSADGALVAFAPAVRWNVVVEPTLVDTTSWEHVSQNGSNDDVLRFLDRANLYRVDLAKIAWRAREPGFFQAVTQKLRERHVYADELWSYGIYHRDAGVTAEYLRHADGFLARCGRALESPLVTLDPVERRAYQHVEFEPLFNPRAHRFGRERTILNDGIAQQYLALLRILAYRPRLDAEDEMSVVYYLALQDRVEEALAHFANVDAEALPTRLQYDYLRAYLDFFTPEHALARGIAEGYRDHPVERWRARFREVLAQLDEAEGKGADPLADGDRTRRQTALADSQPALELAVEARRVTLRYANLDRCRVSYFLMDVEFLFSTHPFVQQDSGAFAYVRPNRSDVVTLPSGQKELAFDLPDRFRNANVIVEIEGGGLTRRQTYFANSLSARWMESYGQVQVSDAAVGKPLSKVYVKVFARVPGGDVRFHKDGYTDLRGRFDYASLSGPDAANVERFAILVQSDEHGAVIREVEPPSR